jgi:hypothetical protein
MPAGMRDDDPAARAGGARAVLCVRVCCVCAVGGSPAVKNKIAAVPVKLSLCASWVR